MLRNEKLVQNHLLLVQQTKTLENQSKDALDVKTFKKISSQRQSYLTAFYT